MRNGSWPTRKRPMSSTEPTTPAVFHSRVASPQPLSSGSSVSTLTNTQFRMRALTTRVRMARIEGCLPPGALHDGASLTSNSIAPSRTNFELDAGPHDDAVVLSRIWSDGQPLTVNLHPPAETGEQ